MSKSKYHRHPKFGFVYGLEVKVDSFRVSFPSLVDPRDPPPPQEGQPPGQPRFELTFLLPKRDPKTEAFLSVVKDMTNEMLPIYNEKAKAKLAPDLTLVTDGDSDVFSKDKYPYYANHWLLVARNTQRMKIVNRKKEVIDPAEIKGGMIATAIVTPLVTSHGVSYKLGIVQLVEDDGTRFGGGQRDMSDFLDNLDGEEPATDTEAPSEVVPVTASDTKSPKKSGMDALDML